MNPPGNSPDPTAQTLPSAEPGENGPSIPDSLSASATASSHGWITSEPATPARSSMGDSRARSREPALARLRGSERARVLGVGLGALALALIGQAFLHPGDVSDGPLLAATACYGLAVVLLLLGWWGSYTNLSWLAIPRAARTSIPVRRVDGPRSTKLGRTLRLGGALLALSAGIWAVRVLRADPASGAGLLFWGASLALLLLAVLSERGASRTALRAEEDRLAAGWHLPRLVEAGIVLAILALALALRLWRLGDLAPGMHGDEGEAGLEALKILNGQSAPPFAAGWFNQSNVYFWSIALGMKLFGSGLAGLRAFAVGCGMLTVLFVYLGAREMFGQRAALIAGTLAAVGSAGLFFSRLEFGNAAIPALISIAFYAVLRGLRSTRHAPFVVAGFAAGAAIYYMATGWLVAVAVVALLAVLLLRHRDFLGIYGSRLAVFGLALALVAAPSWADALDHPVPADVHPNGRYIWSQFDALAAQYATDNWPGVLWGQLTRTLALITHRADGSTLGALDYPPVLPLEAALIVLGLAWAAWRWRDTRFALLSLWFWVPVILGGLPAAYAPNLPRMVAALPALPLLAAAVLDHLGAPIPALVAEFGRRQDLRRAGGLLGAAVVLGTLLIAGLQHGQLFFGYYLNTRQSADVTGQALAVQQLGPAYYYYDLGTPLIFWDHGDNRFVNPTAQGRDVANPADDLPITDNGPNADQDAVFLVWNGTRDYLWALYSYYPDGVDGTVPLSDTTHATPALLTYTVSHEEIDKYRMLQARYTPASGPPVERKEGGIGLSGGVTPPSGLAYPATATWDGALIAPAYQTYGFRLTAPPGARLTIDDFDVLTIPADGGGSTTNVVLARGVHSIHLAAPLADAATRVDLQWTETGGALRHIARRYLWDNHIGRGWLGEISEFNADQADPTDPLSEAGTDVPGARRAAAVYSRRIDGFLGFRDSTQLVRPQHPFIGIWTTVLTVAQAGHYTFTLTSNGDSRLSIDGQVVVDNKQDRAQEHEASGETDLSAGAHTLEVRYLWQNGPGVLDCAWTPPGQPRQPLLAPDLHPPDRGVWQPTELQPAQP